MWSFAKRKEIKEKQERVINAFKEDIEELNWFLDLLKDKEPNLPEELDFQLALESGVRRYSGKGHQDLYFLVRKILPSLQNIAKGYAHKAFGKLNLDNVYSGRGIKFEKLKKILLSSDLLGVLRSALKIPVTRIGAVLAGAGLLLDIIKLIMIFKKKNHSKEMRKIAEDICQLPDIDLVPESYDEEEEEQVEPTQPVEDILDTLMQNPWSQLPNSDELCELDKELTGHADKDQDQGLSESTTEALQRVHQFVISLEEEKDDNNASEKTC